MATKKQTTKAKITGQQDAAAEIAGHISAILNDPATQVGIYPGLADVVNDLDAPQGYYNSVQYLTAQLAVHIRMRAKSRRG